MEKHDTTNEDSSNKDASAPECAICLQTCIHPVRLPCRHIFCYLCVKGIANQSKRCAMCRQEIPLDYLDKPDLVSNFEPEPEPVFEDGFQWFYEGRNGWWQYDERTSTELEAAFKREESRCEVLVAGFLYLVDFNHMIQLRRNDPSRRRRIKRDQATIVKKGVAGIRSTTVEEPNSDDSRDNAPSTDNQSVTDTLVEHPTIQNACTSTNNLLVSKTPSTTPATPTNTPQTPIFVSGDTETSVPSSPGRGLENLDQTLTEALHTLRLHDHVDSSLRSNVQPIIDLRRQTRIQPWDIEITFSEEEEL